MRSVGPWYDDNPGRHLVSRHRCPSHNEPRNTWIIAGGMQAAFPELWHNAKARARPPTPTLTPSLAQPEPRPEPEPSP